MSSAPSGDFEAYLRSPGDAQVPAAAGGQRLRRRAVLASALAVLVVVAGTGWAVHRSGSARRPGVAAADDPVPAMGDRIKGPTGQPYATSGGRLVSATGVLSDTGFGLVAPPPGRTPRRGAQQACVALLAPGVALGPPTIGAGPTISLAMATTNPSQQTQNALVWVFVWTGQTCLPVGPPGTPSVPRPCASWAIESDSTGLLMESGDGTTG
ncbi:MAG: hypothetical protein QOJ11_1500 [Frankiales bacterium]|jgi:hypothetical protein|nr:hypothetical protein [Frankiales bacterium]